MATEGIQIRVFDQAVLDTLASVDRVAVAPEAIMSAIAAYLVTSTQRHFERETGPDGKWRPLSPRTAAKRIGRRRRGTANILRVTNRLYSSITGEATATEAVVGTNLVYAAIQQLGGDIQMGERQQAINLSTGKGRKRFVKASAKRKETRNVTVGAHTVVIPARPYLYLDDEDRAEILRIAEDGFRAEAGVP